MSQKILKVGELFCGPGGLALGASWVSASKDGDDYRFHHAWASDYDHETCQTFIRNICPDSTESIRCEDVRKLDIDKLERIDGFAYGFPCNDFSVVGKQKGFDGTFGPLYTYGIKVLNRFKPKFFVAENVGGLASANEGAAFKSILRDLGKSGPGYVLTAHLYKAEDYGVPQTRHRIIVVGIDRRLGRRFQVPSPTTEGAPITVRQALEEPPIEKDAANHELTKQSRVVLERLKHIRPGENVWTAKLPKRLELNVKGAKLSQIYRRMHPDKPSYTITGSGGGGTHGYHYSELRALTNRERARIQTFPDDFIFLGRKENVRKQIGMAVPPVLAKVIFQAILDTLLEKTYPNIGLGMTERFLS